jgi:hypothetical protein
VSGAAFFRTTAKGREELIAASEATRQSMRARRDLWQSRNAPTMPAALDDGLDEEERLSEVKREEIAADARGEDMWRARGGTP